MILYRKQEGQNAMKKTAEELMTIAKGNGLKLSPE
jgi:hypothetical protein